MEEETWEKESKMKNKHLGLFLDSGMKFQILRMKFIY
jgi:hypothetical protein